MCIYTLRGIWEQALRLRLGLKIPLCTTLEFRNFLLLISTNAIYYLHSPVLQYQNRHSMINIRAISHKSTALDNSETLSSLFLHSFIHSSPPSIPSQLPFSFFSFPRNHDRTQRNTHIPIPHGLAPQDIENCKSLSKCLHTNPPQWEISSSFMFCFNYERF